MGDDFQGIEMEMENVPHQRMSEPIKKTSMANFNMLGGSLPMNIDEDVKSEVASQESAPETETACGASARPPMPLPRNRHSGKAEGPEQHFQMPTF